jgi:hypothetical protein
VFRRDRNSVHLECMEIDVDMSSVVWLTNKLEKISDSAMPTAVRGALNSAAFDVKQRTMPQTSDVAFVKRSPNFFKANSRVEKATGNSLPSLKATVGFIGRGTSEQSVEELEQQERGGSIKKRSFIPMTVARSGGSARPVRPMNRLSKIQGIVNAAKIKAASQKQKFQAAAVKAGPGGYVLGNTAKKTLWRIQSVDRGQIKKKPIYSFDEAREVKVKATGFMKKASENSGSRIEEFYEKEANRIFFK